MKRGRGDTLTGGTGDVNPQWLSFSAVQSAADTTTTTTQNIPIQRLPSGTRAQVMEVLKVYLTFGGWAAVASATELARNIQCFLTTFSSGTTQLAASNPRVFASSTRYQNGAFTAAGTYATSYDGTHMLDLTDGAGHGIIVATDSVFAQVSSSNTGVAQTVHIKVLYRWKDVSLAEYIGIVQSQQ